MSIIHKSHLFPAGFSWGMAFAAIVAATLVLNTSCENFDPVQEEVDGTETKAINGDFYHRIFIPDDDYSMPAKQYILPVIFKTADASLPVDGLQINALLDSYEISPADWTTNSWTDEEYDLVRAVTNLTVGLRLVQEKYRRMLKPLKQLNEDRGTFDIATWVYQGHDLDGEAALFPRTAPVKRLIRPLIVEGNRPWSNPGASNNTDKGYLEMHSTTNMDNIFLGEVYDALGCTRYNCPFVPVMFIADPAVSPLHAGGNAKDLCYNTSGRTGGGATVWNRGYNHGGGGVRMNYYTIVNDNWTDNHQDADHLFNKNKFLSTLVHEIGHIAGVGDLRDPSYNYYTPTSVMSYSEKNHHGNCWGVFDSASLFCQLHPDYADEKAAFYTDDMYTGLDDAATDRYTGILAPREKLAWGYNNRFFDQLVVDPEVDYDCSLYANATNRSACNARNRLIGKKNKDRSVIGHGVTTVTSNDTLQGDLNNILGASAFWFESSNAPFDSSTMWRSKPGIINSFCVNFPEELDRAKIKRIMVLTGSAGSTSATSITNPATLMSVITMSPSHFQWGTQTGTQRGSFIADMPSGIEAHSWCVALFSAGLSSSIDVRGIRLFLDDGNEFYGPTEFSILESYTKPSTGHNDNLVGTTRIIADKTVNSVDPNTMWRAKTNSVGWTSVTVEFPEQVDLSKILVYTGYKVDKTNITDVARKVWIGLRDADGKWVNILKHVDSPRSKKTMNLNTSNSSAKLWKIMFKSGDSGHVVVRGFRFFDTKGRELFEPFIYPTAE